MSDEKLGKFIALEQSHDTWNVEQEVDHPVMDSGGKVTRSYVVATFHPGPWGSGKVRAEAVTELLNGEAKAFGERFSTNEKTLRELEAKVQINEAWRKCVVLNLKEVITLQKETDEAVSVIARLRRMVDRSAIFLHKTDFVRALIEVLDDTKLGAAGTEEYNLKPPVTYDVPSKDSDDFGSTRPLLKPHAAWWAAKVLGLHLNFCKGTHATSIVDLRAFEEMADLIHKQTETSARYREALRQYVECSRHYAKTVELDHLQSNEERTTHP